MKDTKKRVNAKIPVVLMERLERVLRRRRSTKKGQNTTLTDLLILSVRSWLSSQERLERSAGASVSRCNSSLGDVARDVPEAIKKED